MSVFINSLFFLSVHSFIYRFSSISIHLFVDRFSICSSSHYSLRSFNHLLFSLFSYILCCFLLIFHSFLSSFAFCRRIPGSRSRFSKVFPENNLFKALLLRLRLLSKLPQVNTLKGSSRSKKSW